MALKVIDGKVEVVGEGEYLVLINKFLAKKYRGLPSILFFCA